MRKRVAITGMGVVSPNGTGRAEFQRAILAGRSGVKKITRFDPSDISVQIAGEIQDFDDLAWVEKRERKHMSRVLPLAIAAASEALSDAGITPEALSLDARRQTAVVVGSGGGAQ